MTTYPYTPLKSTTEIRILILEPGERDDPLVGSLVHVTFEDHPQYDAISYCWSNCIDEPQEISPDLEVEVRYQNEPDGELSTVKVKYSDMANHPIENVRMMYYYNGSVRQPGELVCDGHTISIGGELHSALKQFRQTDRQRSLWADAICICQNDPDEKVDQIRAMADIFGNAQVVLVWLGECMMGVWEAWEAMQSISNKFDELFTRHGDDPTAVSREFQMDHEMLGLHWDSIAQLLRRAWFKRIWCLQEIVHARKVSIHLGDMAFHWELFGALFSVLRRLNLDSNLWARGEAIGTTTISTISEMRASDKKYLMQALLSLTRQYKSTLPVDKFFAIFSLLCDDDKSDMVMDYRIAPEKLYTDYAVFSMSKYKSLSLLYECFKSQTTSTLTLPTWVPDWTQTQWHETFVSKGLKCKASLDSQAHFEVSQDHQILTVRGRIVDEIAEIDTLRPIPWSSISLPKHDAKVGPEEWRNESFDPTIRQHDGMHGATSSHFFYNCLRQVHLKNWLQNSIRIAFPTGEATKTQYDMLWRTFVCDQKFDGERPGTEWEELFNLWIDINTTLQWDVRDRLDDWDKSAVEWDLRVLPGDETRRTRITRKRQMFGNLNGNWCYNRRFFRSEGGRLGWCPDGVEVGDRVVVVDGLDVPLVLKSVVREDGETAFEVRGDCYIHGLMNGEAIEMVPEAQMLKLV